MNVAHFMLASGEHMKRRRLLAACLALLLLGLTACAPTISVGEAEQVAQQQSHQLVNLVRTLEIQLQQRLLTLVESHLPLGLISRLPGGAPDPATEAAIRDVIQKGNSAQERAIASHDSSTMKDTSTNSYYQQVAQENQQAVDAGVTAIKLQKLDWGPISVHGPIASAVTTETWITTYDDGTTEQSTDRNVYTLLLQNGAWKVQADDQPDGSSPSPVPGSASGAPSPAGRGSRAPTPGSGVATPPSPSPLTVSAPSGSAEAAIQQLIIKGDQEQEQAIASHDSSVMKDTSTDSYYQDLAQSNQDMLNGGITAIKLVAVDWGQVTVTGNTASATNFETWWTQYSDGSTDQTRDRNVYSLVQQSGAWKIDSDDHPDSGLSPAPDTTPTLGSPSPSPAVPPASIAPTGRGSSVNWAGYAANGGTFTAVSGTWTIPQVSGTGSVGADAAWVGIGGEQSRDLLQAGTEETVLSSGRTQYDAWIEMLPQFSHPVPLGVHAGDSVTVSIKEQSSGNWNISFTNNTTGGTYQRDVQYNSSRSSADWIEEAPSGGRGGILPLDNFGSIAFSNATAVKDGQNVNLTQAGASPITMINRSRQPLVTPSAITSDGSGFTVSRTSNSAAAPGGGGSTTRRRGTSP